MQRCPCAMAKIPSWVFVLMVASCEAVPELSVGSGQDFWRLALGQATGSRRSSLNSVARASSSSLATRPRATTTASSASSQLS
jgi:hypothetical protein